MWKRVNPGIKIFEILNEIRLCGYNLYYENMNNFIPIYDVIHTLKKNNYVNILAVLRGESFERNMMNRLCKYCKY